MSDLTSLAQTFANTMTGRMRSETDYHTSKTMLGRVVSVRGADAPVVQVGKQKLKRTSYRIAKSVSVANLKPGDEVLMVETYLGTLVMTALIRTDNDKGDRLGKFTHGDATTNVHGISDTSNLVYTNDVRLAHGDATTNVHGISNTANLVYTNDVRLAHGDATTNVHGISDTANLVYTNDARLTNERAPADGSVTKTKLASTTALQAFNAQTDISYTLGLSDADFGSILTFSNASTVVLTVPNESSVNLPVGSLVNFVQLDAGQVTVVAASGVTVNSQGSKTKTAGQYAVGSLIKMSSNSWLLFGNLVA
jgi:uncharacterized protein YkvS